MADSKISGLPASSTPLAGTELLVVVQGGTTKRVALADLLAGLAVSTGDLTVEGVALISGSVGTMLLEDNNQTAGSRVFGLTSKSGDLFVRSFDDTYSTATDRIKVNHTTGDTTLLTSNLVIGTAGKGIDFSADGSAAGMTSELLDDYEEGTWTPVLKGNSTDGDYSYSTQTGTYTKIGNRVYIDFKIQVSAINTAATGTFLIIDGLPYATANNNSQGSVYVANVDFSNGASHLVIGPRSTVSQLVITEIIDNSGAANVSPADLTSTSFISGSLCYTVA